jgi:hypothetical protein
MVKKQASSDGLGSYLLQRFGQHGVPMMFTGAGVAGLAHLVSLYKEKQKQEQEKEKPSELVIEVPVPKQAESKKANWGLGLDAPVIAGSVAGGFGLGYYVVDQILRKKRQEMLNTELDSTKKQYSKYIAQELAPQKSANEFPTLDGLVLSIVEAVKSVPVEESRKTATLNIINLKKAQVPDPNKGTMASSLYLGFPLVAGLLAGHYLYYNRKKDIQRAIEKEEAESMKRTPENIKVVTKPVAVKNNADENNPELLLEKGAFLEDAAMQKIIEEVSKRPSAPKPDDDGIVKRKEKVVDEELDLQKIDDNTYVILTEGGNSTIDALDPEALKILEQHKDKILKSFALGMNIKK